MLAQTTLDQSARGSRRRRQRRTSSTCLIAFVLAAAVLLPSALAPGTASAASRIRGCFQHSGQAVGGLYAIIEYWGAGQWRPAPGALSTTNVNGCVAFNISPGWRGTHMKIDAIGYVESGGVIVAGKTPYYSPADNGRWYVGTAAMTGYAVPSSEDWSGGTGGWLDGMTGGSSSGDVCGTSPAAAIGCYIEGLGVHINNVALSCINIYTRLPEVCR